MNWKYVDKYAEKYKVYENGDVYDGDEKMEVFVDTKSKKPTVLLKKTGHSQYRFIANLVYIAFVGKIDKNYRMKYKDGNISNVALTNLELVYVNLKDKNNAKEKPEHLTKLKWKYIDNCNNKYKVYENGDIYEENDKVEPFYNSKHQTNFISLMDKDGIKSNQLVGKIVYESFVDKMKSNYKLKYKDGNKMNFNINNLDMVHKFGKNEELNIESTIDKNTKWKYIPNYNDRYKIYENGDVYEENTLIKPFIHKIYKVKTVGILDTNGIKRCLIVARLVYTVFIGDIDLKEDVVYKDSDSNNIHVSNLQKQPKYTNRIENEIKSEDCVEGVKWKYIDGYNNKYKIYENGTIYDGNEKIIIFMHKTLKIPFASFTKGGKSCSYSIARLVYETFIAKIKDGTKLKYKDGNNQNYNLNNLEVIKRHSKKNDELIELDNSKIWKPIRNYEELYKISDYGDVYSVRLNKLMLPSLDGKGYYSIVLNKDKKKKKKLIHILVFTTFNNCDTQKDKVVDHIDRKKNNNHVSNLREVTRRENALNVDPREKTIFDKITQYDIDGEFIKEWNSFKEIKDVNPTFDRTHIGHCCTGSSKTAYGYIWRYTDYIYDQIGYVELKGNAGKKYSKYKINKEGIVINNYGRKMSHITDNYSHVKLVSDCGIRQSYSIHRLVALTFVDNPNVKPMVNHIDEDKLNNNLDNLEWSTASENSRHSLGKKVQQINMLTGKLIKEYATITDAYNEIKNEISEYYDKDLDKIKGSPWGIGQVCLGKRETSFGYKWKFI